MADVRASVALVLLLTGCSQAGAYKPPSGTTPVPEAPGTYQTLDLATGAWANTNDPTPRTGSVVVFRRLTPTRSATSARDSVTADGIDTLPFASPDIVATYGIALTELTQAQWQALVTAARTGDSTPWSTVSWASTTGSTLPAVNLSYTAADTVLDAWSDRFGRRLRLPTSVEWEHAARAGTTTAWSWGDTASGDGKAVVRETTNALATVAGRTANPWGLFDVHGNAWEWVSDGGTDRAPCLRGGSWSDNLLSARSGNRLDCPAATAHPLAGLRLVLETE